MSRRPPIALAAAAVVVAVVLGVGQLLSPASKARDPEVAGEAPRPAAEPPVAAVAPAEDAGSPAPAGPTTTGAGVPMGYGHHAAGAKAAAVAFAQAYGTLVALDEAGAVAAKRAMAATAAADGLVAEMRDKLAGLRRVWPVGAITYRVAPVGVRVRMDGADAAAAEVWYVGVVAGKGLPTYEEWVTQGYRLVWERGDWRIVGEAEAAGPRPDPGRQSPASASELDARLAGFEALS